jgi:outer membrane protein OmpA-like peptidoglycan-associated protein/opacity protein-like surface antigen
MKLRYACLGASLLLAPVAASAQTNGFYVSLGGGFNLMPTVNEDQAYSGPLTPNPGSTIAVGAPASQGGINIPGLHGAGPTYYDTGPVVAGSIGYGFSNNMRVELGIGYSQNRVTRLNNGTINGLGTDPLGLSYVGDEKKLSFMANVFYDFNTLSKELGVPVTPYAGVGVGVTRVDWGGVTRSGGGEMFGPPPAVQGTVQVITNAFYSTDTVLSVQGIVGAAYQVPGVPGLALTADFRMFALPQGFSQHSVLTLTFRPGTGAIAPVLKGPQAYSNWGEEFDYNFVVGLRYSFGAPPPAAAAPPAPIAAAVPASPAARSYMVFFDWDKATLTDRAKQIVSEAATNSTKVQYTRIEVNGYTDTSGTPTYNQGLSVRRAQAVSAELVRDGVPASSIAISGFGETHLLVPTGAGVREPQNRRVEIIIK